MQVEKVKISSVSEVQTGTTKAGKDWKKITFVGNTNEEYNNLYAFELFGKEKVENFTKFNKVGDLVDVDFNVSTREWEGRYFTTLSAWKVFTSKDNEAPQTSAPAPKDESDELPF